MSGANPRRFPASRWPEPVKKAIRTLEAAGWECWAVGGCVRDAAMGLAPHDWDLASSAPPEAVIAAFPGCSVNRMGMRHGTVGVLLDGQMLEITTFRREEGYSDFRHPDGVTFTGSLREDLSRRDFTVNAMALHPSLGFYDPFGGLSDLKERRLRAVGSPVERMQEDPLRILRGLRFIARLGLAPDRETAAAFRSCCPMLGRISRERVYAELTGMLCGEKVLEALLGFPEVLAAAIPELAPLIGFDQHTPYHLYDVWGHTARAVAAIPAKPLLRWVMLLHDIGKPGRFTLDKTGTGHFKGHAALSAAMAEEILLRLAMPGAERKKAVQLIRWHDAPVRPERAHLAFWLRTLPKEQFFRLLAVKRADNAAQNREVSDRSAELDRLEAAARDFLAGNPPLSPKDLAVTGRDLMPLGFSGPELGAALRRLTAGSARGDFPNEKAALLQAARRMKRRQPD